MIDMQSFQAVVKTLSEKVGVVDYEVYFLRRADASVEVLNGEVSSVTTAIEQGFSYRCRIDGKIGYASGESFDVSDVETVIVNAKNNARVCQDESVSTFAEAVTVTCDGATMPTDVKTLQTVALDTYSKAKARADLSEGTETGANGFATDVTVFNSNGLFVQRTLSGTMTFAETVLTENNDTQSSWAERAGLDTKAQKETVTEALEKTKAMFGAVVPKTGKYRIMMTGRLFRQYLSCFIEAFSGKNAMLGLSLLAGKENTPVASPVFSLVDSNARRDMPGTVAYDDEGTHTKTKYLIQKGTLKNLMYDRETAVRAGKKPTGNAVRRGYESTVEIAPRHCSVKPGRATREQMLATMGDGILVTEAKGFHAGADVRSGDFSIESAGFAVKNGKVTTRLKSFTLSGNFFDLLKAVVCVGRTVDFTLPLSSHTYGSPDILFGEMSVAGE